MTSPGGDLTPPVLWRRVLTAILPKGIRGEAIRGDMEEEFREEAERTSVRVAGAWYRRQVLGILVRYRLRRLFRHGRPRTTGDRPDSSPSSVVANLADDVRHGWRRLARSPVSTLVAVVLIAIGTGATTAVFSVLDAVLLRPLPYLESHRLVQLWETNPEAVARRGLSSSAIGVNLRNYRDFERSARSLESMAFMDLWSSDGRTTLSGGSGPPELVDAMSVSASFFDVLGEDLFLGRPFSEDEIPPPGEWGECDMCWRYTEVGIISHDLWLRKFGRDPDILGRTIRFASSPMTVVGVAPPGFRVPPLMYFGRSLERDVDVFVPMHYPAYTQERNFKQYAVMARLAPGVELEQAEADLGRLMDGIVAEHPETMEGWTIELTPLNDLQTRHHGSGLYTLLAIVGFVLVIACADVANLLLARGAGRRTEMAVRASVGGGRAQLARLLLVESLLLATIGGAAGLLVAFGGTNLLLGMAPDQLPRPADAGVSLRVLGFAMGLALLTGIGTGLLPAIRSSDVDLGQTLKGGSTGQRGRFWKPARLLIAGQVALTLALLVAGGFLAKSFVRLRSEELLYDPQELVGLELKRGYHHPVVGHTYDDEESRALMWRVENEILERVGRVPGVVSAAWGPMPLATGEHWPSRIQLEAYEGEPPQDELVLASYLYVSPGYFQTMDIPILRGEGLPEWDGVDDWRHYWWATACGPEGGPHCKAVVSESFAANAWPGEDPLGKPLGMWGCCLTVAGIVPDVRLDGFDATELPGGSDPVGQVYVPWPEAPLIVKASVDPASIVEPVREAILEVDPEAVVTATLMEDRISEAFARPRFYLLVAGILGGMALLMAMVGLYGVISYGVSRRTSEIGIRIALGAAADQVRGLILAQALAPVLVGLGVGLLGVFAIRGWVERFLYGIDTGDPWLVLAVVVGLGGSAALASYLPARRASRVDPVRALTTE